MSKPPLGRKTRQPRGHDPSVLFPIERKPCRVPIHGYDLWRSYELSWLNERGRPEAGILELVYPVQSGFIVESKSFKLYLAGLSYDRFASAQILEDLVRGDLEGTLRTPWLSVRILGLRGCNEVLPQDLPGETSLDTLDITLDPSPRNPGVLSCGRTHVEETLTSDLLRTFCPITEQPDWSSVMIRYRGRIIDHASLLRYICSYRDHKGFAEEVSELIYADLMERCTPETLQVTCFYTRRGGIDITAHRRSGPVGHEGVERIRLIRQ